MLQYIVRRLMIAVVTLFCITFLMYCLVRNMPGDPTTIEAAGSDARFRLDETVRERNKRIYGLHLPVTQAYFVWLGNALRGDLGQSYSQKQRVVTAIKSRIGPTLLLSLTSMVLALAVAIPVGLVASVRSGRMDERAVSTLFYMLYSFPTFVAALLLQYYFYSKLGWLPLDRMHSDGYESLSTGGRLLDILWHAVLPVTCYTYTSLAYDSRFIRATMAEVLRQDYIRTAQAKGVGPFGLIVKHAFRNTLIPLVTLLGLLLPTLMSGTVILESIFTWPGMGLLFLDSLHARDYWLSMGLTLLFSVITLLGTLLSDILYAVVDPRVTYS